MTFDPRPGEPAAFTRSILLILSLLSLLVDVISRYCRTSKVSETAASALGLSVYSPEISACTVYLETNRSSLSPVILLITPHHEKVVLQKDDQRSR